MGKKALNLLIIGCGPHVRRSYLPAFKAMRSKYPVRIAVIVELESQRKTTVETIKSLEIGADLILTAPFTPGRLLPLKLRTALNKAIQEHQIDGVIIATEPQMHMPYALWAIQKGLHILMDKPISARQQAASASREARGLQKDYELLCAKRDPAKAFMISVQRRYEPGFTYIMEQVEEVARKYRMPITSMQAMHADGQWRLPQEVMNESYHGYDHGYGIISHGGYHVADVCSTMIQRAALVSTKTFDRLGVYTSLIKPDALLYQQSATDLKRVFGKSSDSFGVSSRSYQDFGEVDVSSIVTFYAKGRPVSNLAINLMHNSFSRRSWIKANADLYNSNGRTRHEYYNIEQGPYQNIQIHSYHTDQESLSSSEGDYELGGNEHLDVYVFRNSGLIGGKPLEVLRANEAIKSDSGLNTVEQAKYDNVQEFLEITLGIRPSTRTKSDLLTHALTVQMASLMYRSGITRKEVIAPLLNIL